MKISTGDILFGEVIPTGAYWAVQKSTARSMYTHQAIPSMKNALSLTSVAVACALFAISTTGCGKKEAAPATTPSAAETAPAATTPAAPAANETAPAAATTGDAATKTITITNQTKFDVNEIYLSPVDHTDWGDDILGDNDVLKPGQSIEGKISCGKWDAQLVAMDGSKCVVEDVDICGADVWNVTADCPGAE